MVKSRLASNLADEMASRPSNKRLHDRNSGLVKYLSELSRLVQIFMEASLIVLYDVGYLLTPV